MILLTLVKARARLNRSPIQLTNVIVPCLTRSTGPLKEVGLGTILWTHAWYVSVSSLSVPEHEIHGVWKQVGSLWSGWLEVIT